MTASIAVLLAGRGHGPRGEAVREAARDAAAARRAEPGVVRGARRHRALDAAGGRDRR